MWIRHLGICRFFSAFGRCKFREYCRFKNVEINEHFGTDKEIEKLKALLVLKDDKNLAIAQKIDKMPDILNLKIMMKIINMVM